MICIAMMAPNDWHRCTHTHTHTHTHTQISHTHTKWAMIRKPGRGRGKKGNLNVKKQTMRKG